MWRYLLFLPVFLATQCLHPTTSAHQVNQETGLREPREGLQGQQDEDLGFFECVQEWSKASQIDRAERFVDEQIALAQNLKECIKARKKQLDTLVGPIASAVRAGKTPSTSLFSIDHLEQVLGMFQPSGNTELKEILETIRDQLKAYYQKQGYVELTKEIEQAMPKISDMPELPEEAACDVDQEKKYWVKMKAFIGNQVKTIPAFKPNLQKKWRIARKVHKLKLLHKKTHALAVAALEDAKICFEFYTQQMTSNLDSLPSPPPYYVLPPQEGLEGFTESTTSVGATHPTAQDFYKEVLRRTQKIQQLISEEQNKHRAAVLFMGGDPDTVGDINMILKSMVIVWATIAVSSSVLTAIGFMVLAPLAAL